MSHPEVENKLPFAFEPLFLVDEDMRPLLVPVVKGTYNIHNGRQLILADDQVPFNLSGEFWGDPEVSSYKYEPEFAFVKPATDVVLIGHAHAPKPNVKSVNVRIRVGPMEKVVRVVGDRYLVKKWGTKTVIGPKPFEKVPLVYERAFGGWDRSHANPNRHTFEPRNPVGVGFGLPDNHTVSPIRLPNLEDPKKPWKRWGDRPTPAGFGFISPHWQPRASFAGTYDKTWDDTRKPLLPTDFDRRFFNAASSGLTAPGYLSGNEPVLIENASSAGRITFYLPGVPPPQCTVVLRGGEKKVLSTRLDTIVINADDNLLILTWRTYMRLKYGPQDIISIKIFSDSIPLKTTFA